jgi:hypothetical protein
MCEWAPLGTSSSAFAKGGLDLLKSMLKAAAFPQPGLLRAIVVVLFLFWIFAFAVHLFGGLIHLLLVAALGWLIFSLVTGRAARM